MPWPGCMSSPVAVGLVGGSTNSHESARPGPATPPRAHGGLDPIRVTADRFSTAVRPPQCDSPSHRVSRAWSPLPCGRSHGPNTNTHPVEAVHLPAQCGPGNVARPGRSAAAAERRRGVQRPVHPTTYPTKLANDRTHELRFRSSGARDGGGCEGTRTGRSGAREARAQSVCSAARSGRDRAGRSHAGSEARR
jgi:hypothetical protein